MSLRVTATQLVGCDDKPLWEKKFVTWKTRRQ
jgi:hypothetical protein